MNSIELIIKGDPVGQPRYAQGKNKNKYIPDLKTKTGKRPHPVKAYKKLIWATLLKSKNFRFIEKGNPVAMGFKFYFKVPDHRKKFIKEGDCHLQTPDIDNCIKAVKDALNKKAYDDDCQVCKYIGEPESVWTHGEARTEIIIEEM